MEPIVAAPVPVVEVRTTVDDAVIAQEMARSVVARRVAACAHVSAPVTSWYWWEDELQCTEEHEVTARTTPGGVAAVVEVLLSLHTYGLPAIVVTPAAASEAYGRWVAHESTGSAP